MKIFFITISLFAGSSSNIFSLSCKRKTVLKKTSLGGRSSLRFHSKSLSFLKVISSKLAQPSFNNSSISFQSLFSIHNSQLTINKRDLHISFVLP